MDLSLPFCLYLSVNEKLEGQIGVIWGLISVLAYPWQGCLIFSAVRNNEQLNTQISVFIICNTPKGPSQPPFPEMLNFVNKLL